jgi:hypothetical protein
VSVTTPWMEPRNCALATVGNSNIKPVAAIRTSIVRKDFLLRLVEHRNETCMRLLL